MTDCCLIYALYSDLGIKTDKKRKVLEMTVEKKIIEKQYFSDIEAILSHKQDNGADYWATPDKNLIKGSPFSTLESVLYLLDLGLNPDDPVLKACAELIFSVWREDGRLKLTPKSAIYPCHTTHAASILCRMGYSSDERVKKTLQHLLDTQYHDGGWRCNKFSFGRGPETEYSNPHPTLNALDAFRYSNDFGKEPALDQAVDFLLLHWTIRKPIGPCHYGIGKLFMQVEYPFRSYNLFFYVYVLSFYERARKDSRFLDAFHALESRMSDGQIVVQRINRKLSGLTFCRQGEPSALATLRYQEILKNVEPNTL